MIILLNGLKLYVKKNMKVSVIIPAYKFSKYIEQSVLSVLWQKTNFDFEVLVRDDFSQDGTDKILERLQYHNPNLKLIESFENWGGHKNITFLLSEAKGEYIAYLDGDDYFTDQNKLQKQVDFLDNNPDYAMHTTGYWMLKNDLEYIPNQPTQNLCSAKEDITTEDLFVHNYVSFGRMFRNTKNLIKDYMFELPFLDYPLNYEISLLGKIKNETWPSGVYREHGDGVITKLTDDEKKETHNYLKNYLKEKYYTEKMKTISMIDCFVHSKSFEQKLNQTINNLKSINQEILLISNSGVKSETLSNIDYYIYDKNNILFKNEYDNVKNITLFHISDVLTVNDTVSGLQKHGLSVLINIFKSLTYAKELGYTHFQRFECDDLMGENSLNFLKTVPQLCQNENKKGLFYFNENNEYQHDVSFHYFFCEIDYFLKLVEKISCEVDYLNFITKTFNNNNFINAEEFLYYNIVKNDIDNLILRKTGEQMNIDFNDTWWNTETSTSNISEKYESCTTRLYRVILTENNVLNEYSKSIGIVSVNYSDTPKNRLIKIYYNDGSFDELHQSTPSRNSWFYTVYDNNISHIEVFEGDRFLYEEKNINVLPSIVFN